MEWKFRRFFRVQAVKDETDDRVERGYWTSKAEYLLTMIGYAVGLGNVWRFPFLAYKNGGGAFLIPYVIMLAFAGVPLFFLECSIGQFSSLGSVDVWKAVPLFQGVGITMVLVSSIVSIYYNVIIAYSLYYMFASFQSPLPWADCFSWWGADETCSKTHRDPLCNISIGGHFEVVNTTWLNANNKTCPDGSKIDVPHQGPSEQYWDHVALRRSSSIDVTGDVVWYLALCLILAWIIVGVTLAKGIKSSGKVVYFTATFPYLVLVILLIRGITLEGAHKGIEFYIGRESDITRLGHAEVWKDAATQIFFSLSVGWGGIAALSSYNRFHNNCYADAIVICVVNCATSVFAGFAIFSILGHMAHIQNKPVPEIVQSGFGLAFIAYPEALTQLPAAPFWSILFFFMLVTLGIDSQFALTETALTTLVDQFPKYLRTKRYFVTFAVCLFLFLIGLVCITEAGIYWINLMDHFTAGWGILVAAVVELIVLSWVYGVNRFIQDIEMMIGERSWLFWLWWRGCWAFVSPTLLLAILIWSLTAFSAPTYGPIQYPGWAVGLGWCMIIFCIMWIPIIAIIRIYQANGSNLWQKIVTATKSTPDWGPYLIEHRGERYDKTRYDKPNEETPQADTPEIEDS
ncbi:sodium- and chloride-dependent neutral and basic amino acid transporter B(0+)-like [Scyliorhinus canicula]|uniref:sodium- and chloride-dependent neutral and basic amino acid transporter B(0+)-like n=1 Tax=Scyliorhinus canicula TaxID=7830 RepID=UPI0018F28379|nr:sodium- and chloride-dependent neutral and basic amino acid transporter B(0+)-like [Scyliorhinus canicula]